MKKTLQLHIKFDPPPIPYRGSDWSCYDFNTHDYDTPVGFGGSTLEAIIDYLRTQEGFEDIHLELHHLANKFSPVCPGPIPPNEDNNPH